MQFERGEVSYASSPLRFSSCMREYMLHPDANKHRHVSTIRCAVASPYVAHWIADKCQAAEQQSDADKPASPVPSTSTEFKPFVLARDGNILLSNLSSLTSEVAEKSTIIESINGPRQFLENWPKGELKKVPYRMPSGILAKAVPITCSRTRIASPEGNAPNTCNHLNLPPTG